MGPLAQRSVASLFVLFAVTNAIALPSLGRNLSSGNVTVNLVEPGSLYGARQNNLDMRVAKIIALAGPARSSASMSTIC